MHWRSGPSLIASHKKPSHTYSSTGQAVSLGLESQEITGGFTAIKSATKIVTYIRNFHPGESLSNTHTYTCS